MSRFLHPTGSYVQSDVPLVISAFEHLQAIFPECLEFDELCRRAQAAAKVADADMPQQRQQLAAELLDDWLTDLIELHAEPYRFTTRAADQPQVSAVARQQARLGPNVTTLRHEMLSMDEECRKVIQWIDGTRAQPALARKVAEEILTAEAGGAGGSLKSRRQTAEQYIRSLLGDLARRALLVRP